MGTKYIAYHRVSTQKQGQSGLSLERQEEICIEFVERYGGELIQPAYVEIESGRKNDRPELQKALRACRKHGATLLVSKVSRLARNAALALTILDSGVPVIACDLPNADKMVLQFMAVIAERQAYDISVDTKNGLAAAKARGVVLGQKNWKPGLTKGTATLIQKAENRRAMYGPMIAELRAQGHSLRKIAAILEERNIESPRGRIEWSASMVKNYLPAA